MKLLRDVLNVAEYLSGQTDDVPPDWPRRWEWLWTGVLWAVLGCLIWVFCGQGSKFIYIDF